MVSLRPFVRTINALLIGACCLIAAPAPATAQKSPAQKSSVKKSSAKSTPKKQSAKSSTRSAPKQTAPTAERTQEIQQALTKHGFPVEPTGKLDADTVDALKRFQQQQKLDPTGKLNSLTLIGLGLGPSTEATNGPGQTPAQKDTAQ